MARKGLPKSYIKKYGISKQAWREYRKAQGKTKRKRSNPSKKKTKRRRSNPKRSVRRVARKITIPLAVIGGIAGMPAVQRAVVNIQAGAWDRVMRNLSQIVGVDQGRFNSRRLLENMTPLVIGILVHKVVGGMLGVNRTLGRMKIPLIRI